MNLRDTIKLCCIVALTLCGCAVLLWLSVFIIHMDGLVQDAHGHEREIADGTKTLIATAQKVSETAYQAEQQQIVTLGKTNLEVYKTAAAARLVLVRFDRSINDQLVPRLSTAASHSDAAIVELQRSIIETSDGLRAPLQSFAQATAKLNELLADPTIPASLANANAGLVQINASLTDVRQMADKARETYLKPVNLWWAAVKELLPLAGAAAQVVK